MTFQRARSDEQREQRRCAILGTAADMLVEMPVAQLSLNELSRRVGLAKSNVLRYFESREAVLLELLSRELQAWVDALDLSALGPGASLIESATAVASEIAATLGRRPVLCDLISAQAAVLERNISTPVALAHKRAVNVSVGTLSDRLAERLSELDSRDLYQLIATTILMTSAAWPQSQPTEALQAAYAQDPAIGAHRMEFVQFIEETVMLTIVGLQARRNLRCVSQA